MYLVNAEVLDGISIGVIVFDKYKLAYCNDTWISFGLGNLYHQQYSNICLVQGVTLNSFVDGDKITVVGRRNVYQYVNDSLSIHHRSLSAPAWQTIVSNQNAKPNDSTQLTQKNANVKLTEQVAALQDEAQVAEFARLLLSLNAESVAKAAVQAENTRLNLEDHAMGLAGDAVASENAQRILEEQVDVLARQADIDEHIRFQLAKHSDFLANRASDLAVEASTAETARLALAEHAKRLASEVLVVEKSRVELSAHAQELAKVATDAESKINLMSHHVGELVREVSESHQTVLELQLEKKKMDLERIVQVLDTYDNELDNVEILKEAQRLSLEVIRRTVADQQLMVIINTLPIIIWVVDLNGVFTMSEGRGLSGIYSLPGSLVGTSIQDFIPQEVLRSDFTADSEVNATVQELNLRGRWFELNYIELSVINGKVGTIILARDVTEERLLKAEHQRGLLSEQEARVKATFLANMSHEINTPLFGISSNVAFLLQTDLNELQAEYVNSLQASCSYLQGVVNDILDATQIQDGFVELIHITFNVRQVITQSVSVLKQQAIFKKLQLVHGVQNDMPEYVSGDPNRLQQILVNLIGNAVKFTDHGTVSVDASFKEVDSQVQLCVKVKDSGIGMSKEEVDQLFCMFSQKDQSTTRLYGGTGLRLYISQKLIQLMQGSIKVESIKHQGSTFTLNVLLEKVSTDKVSRVVQVATVDPLNDLNILVAEDNKLNQKIIKQMLETAGATLVFAENGKIALEIWRAHSPDYFHMIITDCHMPVMDGYEATRLWRQEGCHLFILALTADAQTSNVSKCIQAGMNDFISKPVKRQFLVDKIRLSLKLS